MADIRISQLPLATGPTAPAPTDVAALDGLTTRKAPLSSLADAIRPMASQAEAEAGTNAAKGMSPLTTAQAIAAIGATAAQGVLADTALQPSSIGVDIQPFSGNLSEISSVDPGTAGKEVLSLSTYDDIYDYVDPLKEISGDGTTDDTIAFAQLELKYRGRSFDMKGKVYKVTSIPFGNSYKNGFFAKTNGEAINPKDILYPMSETFNAQGYKLTTGPRYDGWPQDKWHAIDGVVFALWNQGSTHTSTDLHVCCARSYDGGRTFVDFERLFQSRSFPGGVTSWAAGHCDGQQFIIVRQGDPVSEHRLYARRIGQVKKINAQIISTAGSSGYQFVTSSHGVRSGNKVKFSADISIGGATILGNTEYNVTNGTPSRFFFTGPVASTSQTLSASDYVVTFVESSFTELNWSGVALGSHLIATNPDQTSQPTLFHSLAGVPGTGGTFYSCVHGGTATAGPTLLQFTGMLGNAPLLAKYNKITTASRVEASVCVDPSDGYLYGFARTQFTNNSPLAWWSSDQGTTFNTSISGPVGALQYSVFPSKIVGDYIYAYGSANRAGTDDISGNYQKGQVPLFLFRAKKSDFRATYWNALQMIQVGEAYKYSDWAGTNAVGVGSMVEVDGKLILAHSTDNEDSAQGTGRPDIEYIILDIEGNLPERSAIQSFAGSRVEKSVPTLAMYDSLHVETLKGSSGVYVKGLIQGTTGTAFSSDGVSSSRTGVGVHVITWPTMGTNNRVFAVATSRNANVRAIATGIGPNGCTVSTFGVLNTTPTDGDFQIEAGIISDWTRDGWT